MTHDFRQSIPLGLDAKRKSKIKQKNCRLITEQAWQVAETNPTPIYTELSEGKKKRKGLQTDNSL